MHLERAWPPDGGQDAYGESTPARTQLGVRVRLGKKKASGGRTAPTHLADVFPRQEEENWLPEGK